jgi:hypothetical protein
VPLDSSVPGLPRQPIFLRKILAKRMDARLKPAHDNHPGSDTGCVETKP